jgi:hypothetical protein
LPSQDSFAAVGAGPNIKIARDRHSLSRLLQHVARTLPARPHNSELPARLSIFVSKLEITLATTMTSATASNAIDMAMSHEPKVATPMYEVGEKQALTEKAVLASSDSTESHHLSPPVEFEADLEGEEPTEEELVTLRRVSGKIPWVAFTIAFVELCERFGYYGCQVLCMSTLSAILIALY